MHKVISDKNVSLNALESKLYTLSSDGEREVLFDKLDFAKSFSSEHLPDPILECEGIRVFSFTLTARLDRAFSWDAYHGILEHLRVKVGEGERYGITIGFEERSSEQSPEGYDTVSIFTENSKGYFSYRANGSKVCTEVQYGKSFIVEIVETVGLPIDVFDSDGFYSIAHKEGKELRTSGGILGRHPSSFLCEVGEDDDTNLLLRMLRVFCDRASF